MRYIKLETRSCINVSLKCAAPLLDGPYPAGVGSGGDLAACVIWTSDYTTTPNILQASHDGGTVAGPALVHIRFTPPSNYQTGSAQVALVTATEDADHYPTAQLATNVAFGNSTANPGCDCGDPADDPNTIYCDVPWPTNQATSAGYHSSTHLIYVQVTYLTNITIIGGSPACAVMDGRNSASACQTQVGANPLPPSTMSTELTVDVQNVVITSTTPASNAPIVWSLPASSSPAPTVNLSATITAANSSLRHVTVEICNVNDPAHPINVIAQDVNIGGATTSVVNAVWNGLASNGDVAPKGLYLFRWKVTSPQIPNGDTDVDKSELLNVTVSNSGTPSMPRSTLISDDGTTATYTLQYTITETNGTPAAAGTVDAYSTELSTTLIPGAPPAGGHAYTMAAADLTPGTHTVTIAMPSPVWPVYVFLITVQDNEAANDKGHRQRYRHIGASADLFAINFDFNNYPRTDPPGPTGTTPYADPNQVIGMDVLSGAKWQKNAGYFMLPATYTNQTAAYARDKLMAKNDPKLEKAFIFSVFGHGGSGAAAQIVYQTFWTGTVWTNMTGNRSSIKDVEGHWPVTYDAATWANLEWLGTLPDDSTWAAKHTPDPANPTPLGRTEMAMFIGCNDGSQGVVTVASGLGISPSQMAVMKGAKYGTGFRETIFETWTDNQGNSGPAAPAWAEAFNHYLYTITPAPDGHLRQNSIFNAYTQAVLAAGGPDLAPQDGLSGFVVYCRGAGGAVAQDPNQGANMFASLPLAKPKQN